jgi:VWFA-related protein
MDIMRREEQTAVSVLSFVILLIGASLVSAQDFKIRAKVDLVEVPVTVKSSGDELVTGLSKNDFLVLEDGRPQTISNFTIDPAPLSAAVVIDTGLTPGSLSKVQQTLPALAGAFSEFDEVAVYRYDKFVSRVLDFSQDVERIDVAMKGLREVEPIAPTDNAAARGPFSTPGPVINGAPVVPPGQLGVITTSPPKSTKALHDAIFEAAADLGRRERNRRKIVLVISDGDVSGSTHSFEETVQSLHERGVQVYAVGLDQPLLHRKLSILNDYTEATGGDVYYVNSVHGIENAYSTATEEARNQYVLGYISTNEVSGTGPVFRNIIVEVPGKKLKTLHRKGYYQFP